ncbi:MAG: CRTAC1 family protein [Planctomycetes bacterium]|nr:CRTAC1 family protein [Planctomycetota bacterium]
MKSREKVREAILTTVLLILWTATAIAGDLAFEDVTEKVGLSPHLRSWRIAHAAAWGDADGNGRPDLYLGAFADRPMYGKENSPIPNPLFLNRAHQFVLSPDSTVRLQGERARTTMALFCDLDNDHDLDLIAGQHARRKNNFATVLFENNDRGRFNRHESVEVGIPAPWQVRNITAFDADRNGLLDLFLTDGRYGNNKNNHPLLLLNEGEFQFKDASREYKLPRQNMPSLGLTAGDVDNDGDLDIFTAHANVLLLRAGDHFTAFRPAGLVKPRGESWPCGAAFGDLNGDDRLDLVITVHGKPGEFHVYLNEESRGPLPHFRRVNGGKLPSSGFRSGIAVKGAHVALEDMDNDGRRDIVLSATWINLKGTVQPLVLQNMGVGKDRTPRFHSPNLERCNGYYAPGPIADYDRDGRLDVFHPAWHKKIPNILWHNLSKENHWLDVRVRGTGDGFNSMGIGATVRIYSAGKSNQKEFLLGRDDITIGNGYSSGEEALAHFGLGSSEKCDVVVKWQKKQIIRRHVKVNRCLVIPMP